MPAALATPKTAVAPKKRRPVARPATEPETMADVIKRLGGVPADRVLMRPTPGTATEEDALDERFCELVDGTLVRKALGHEESRLGVILGYFIEDFLGERNVGFTVGADALHRLATGCLRGPDVAFTLWERTPRRRMPKEAIGSIVPDLAVEVLSRGNRKAEIERKRNEYFAAGVRLVWIADPRKRTVEVWTDAHTRTTLDESGTLDGGDVLPGFALPIREWFRRAERGGR